MAEAPMDLKQVQMMFTQQMQQMQEMFEVKFKQV